MDPAIRMLRRDEQRTMTDTCHITRDGEGDPVFNPDTGEYDDPPRIDVYGTATSPGKCRFVPVPTAERVVESAGSMEILRGYEVGLPWDAPEVLEGDRVQAVEAADPDLPGKRMRVMDVPYTTWQTRRRLICRFQHGDEDEG